ncbi:MAG TPA: phage terminase small subunit P27 family [Syntrophobacter fumaroxidans]|nr:phage terminase small subunit P27 family [Syntrophobacter fumaroxidans]
MGKRGPAPKPAEIRILEGNRGRLPINDNRPRPTGKASCPKHLPLDAKREWRRIVGSLPPGMVTAADVPLLAAFCVAWALHKEASAHIQAESAVILSKNEQPYQNPWLSILNRQAEIMAKLGSRFGLSPSDRNGIKLPEKPKSGKWAPGLIG